MVNTMFVSIGIALANAVVCLLIAFPIAYIMAETTKNSTKRFY
jgi:ABC-type spermidine/putrescine transport system permease subunit I